MTGLLEDVVVAGSPRRAPTLEGFVIVEAGAAEVAAYRRLRRDVFVIEQGLFAHSDADDVDDDPRTRIFVALTPEGELLGGVRIHPMTEPDLGWWRGSRLAVVADGRLPLGVGASLIRAACAAAEGAGAIRFDATVQEQNERLFLRLGWTTRERSIRHGLPHFAMEWPIGRVQGLVDATKSVLGSLVGNLLGGDYRGDDGAPVPGSDLIAACDAILPSMVERDPEWAGWCAVLVNVNDLTAMGARPVGLLDAIGARDASFARRVLRGIHEASEAWNVPVLGGHTQLGVSGALSITALGHTARPVAGGGGRPGHHLRVIADLGGGWRPGYTGAQWDSTSHRSPEQLQEMTAVVAALRPSAAKDVSMSGLIGTVGMLAEASGCAAVLDVAAIPAPADAVRGDWLTCFPGYAMVTAEPTRMDPVLPHYLSTAICGELTTGTGVGLRWPDGVVTQAVRSGVTGLGPDEGNHA